MGTSLSHEIKETKHLSFTLRDWSSQLYDLTEKAKKAIQKRHELEEYYDEYDFKSNEENLCHYKSEIDRQIYFVNGVISELIKLIERGYEIPEEEKRDCEWAIESARNNIEYAENKISEAKVVLDQI